MAPGSERHAWIEGVRRRYDPIAAAVPPHFTLVYPFDAALDPALLLAHMRSVLAAFREFASRSVEYAARRSAT